MPRVKATASKRAQRDEFSSDEEEDEETEEDDSDFEDPDLIEVPGGGRTLKTMKDLKGGKAKGGQGAAGNRNQMKLVGDVTQSKNPRSLLKRNNTSMTLTSAPAHGSPVVYDVPDDDDAAGLEVLRVIPSHSKSQLRGPGMSSGIPGRSGVAAAGSSGSRAGAAGYSSLLNDRLMAAQDPYSMGLMRNSQQTTDLLQKSMQNGGLSRLLGSINPYSMLGGSGNAAAVAAAAAQLGGLGSLNNPFSPAGLGFPSSGSGLYPGGLSTAAAASGLVGASGAAGGAMGAAALEARQISNLWMNSTSGLGSSASMAMQQRQQAEQDDEEVAAEDEDDMGVIETYSNYMPVKLKIGQPHPDAVVETASMASVEPPDVWYDLNLPQEVIDEGRLSALQLESITYASQQHEQFLADGNRAGFLIGDGAGVGKGRTIAGLIFENFCAGRKRAIWVSVSNDLKYDCERDLKDIGAKNIDVYFLSKMKYGKINSSLNGNVKKGVLYATYSALIGESQTTTGKYKTRLKQLLHWCGEDFDGCIVFDECHRAKNLCPTGAGKPTKTGQTVLELQQKLPKARIVYASATGASEPKHMAYMVRLGIWGPGSPFKNFQEFLGAVEKRGVGAMEVVAMDMKLRGMYIARQLSFQGVGFRIDQVELADDIREVYNQSVELWVDLLHKFVEAAELIDADKKMKKTMWGQFWSSHQRFFKYLCIASKVRHVVSTASEVLKMGKCVVIGLQSTGEARTMEALEREEELTDFVSTAKGVLQSLIEKHFPAPDRDRINRLLGIIKKPSMLDELGIKLEGNGNGSRATSSSASSTSGNGSRKPRRQAAQKKKMKLEMDSDSDGDGSDFELSNEEEEEEDDDFDDAVDEDEEGSSDFNPFGSGSEDDDDDPWARGRKRKAPAKKKKKKVPKKPAVDPYAHLYKAAAVKKEENGSSASSSNSNSLLGGSSMMPPPAPSQSNIDRACQMKADLLRRVERLGSGLPANTLDQLIDELGGPENVAEMTGRKGRVVQDENGDVKYESRSEQDAPLETLNLTEKNRFMNGEKDVAVISEAASSGISLQADRRVRNRKRRVHMTLELPWSADRAIQQFGRTHRSNQVSAPEYILLISDLAGEHRFASIVAKRLESLGALTHGDRRATESRDLSRFNIDNKYGRAALESTFKAIMGYETPVVKPPADYRGEFFKDIADGLVGVGLITQSEDMPGVLALDKGYNDMSKFLNRILGMKVELQNLLFRYFSDTLNAIVSQAKRSGRYDQGILDVGLTEEDHVELVKTHTFVRKHATGSAKIELHVLHVERGLSWSAACEKWEELVGVDEGFYLSHQIRNNKKTAILAIQVDQNQKKGKKGGDKMFLVYRPNTGQQVKQESLADLKKKYKKVSKDEAQPHWNEQFESSAKRCSHAYWKGNCKNKTLGLQCEVGLRRKTYNVLTGSVLSVWIQVEQVLTHDGNRKGTTSKMQIVRLKLVDGKRIVGTLIPSSAMSALLKSLTSGSEESEETIY